jgi:hypothetical protein
MMMNSRKGGAHKLISSSVIKTQPDERENYFSVESDQLMLVRSIWLHLASENKSRNIGILHVKDRVLKIKRNRARHLFKKNNSYGFSEHIIRTAILFDHILIEDDYGVYRVPREEIMSNGTYLDFKQIGFEKQIFLSLEIIERYRTSVKK